MAARKRRGENEARLSAEKRRWQRRTEIAKRRVERHGGQPIVAYEAGCEEK